MSEVLIFCSCSAIASAKLTSELFWVDTIGSSRSIRCSNLITLLKWESAGPEGLLLSVDRRSARHPALPNSFPKDVQNSRPDLLSVADTKARDRNDRPLQLLSNPRLDVGSGGRPPHQSGSCDRRSVG